MIFCDLFYFVFCFFKQKTAYEMRSSDWSSDVCSSDLFNGLALRLETRRAKSFVHKIIIDDDVGPHDVYPFLRSYTYDPLKAFAIHHGILPTLKHGTRR